MGEKEARNPSLIGQLSMWATMETSCDGLMTHAVEECIDGFFSLYSYFTLRLILLVFALLYLAITGPLLARRLTTIGSDTNLSAREEAGGKMAAGRGNPKKTARRSKMADWQRHLSKHAKYAVTVAQPACAYVLFYVLFCAICAE